MSSCEAKQPSPFSFKWLVPRPGQPDPDPKNFILPKYPCRKCNLATSRFYAKDNVPEYGHLCRICFGMIKESEQNHYVEI